MFQIFLTEIICTIGMLGFFLISIAGIIILAARYGILIREAEHMSITKRKALKAIKTKFFNSYGKDENTEEDKYKIQEQVNVEVFVDKFVNKLKFSGLKAHTWRFLCGQSLIISIFFAGMGIFRGIIAERTLKEISPFYLIAFLELYVFFSISSICDFEGKEKLLRLTIVEYLENHMVNRMRVVRAFQEEERNIQKLSEEKSRKNTFSKEREQELESLLQEFLI